MATPQIIFSFLLCRFPCVCCHGQLVCTVIHQIFLHLSCIHELQLQDALLSSFLPTEAQRFHQCRHVACMHCLQITLSTQDGDEKKPFDGKKPDLSCLLISWHEQLNVHLKIMNWLENWHCLLQTILRICKSQASQAS